MATPHAQNTNANAGEHVQNAQHEEQRPALTEVTAETLRRMNELEGECLSDRTTVELRSSHS